MVSGWFMGVSGNVNLKLVLNLFQSAMEYGSFQPAVKYGLFQLAMEYGSL